MNFLRELYRKGKCLHVAVQLFIVLVKDHARWQEEEEEEEEWERERERERESTQWTDFMVGDREIEYKRINYRN